MTRSWVGASRGEALGQAPRADRPADVTTVLDLVECLLRERGWCRGRPRTRSGHLSLDGAVDEAATVLARSERERLVLASRTRNRLSRAGGAGALGSWNDRPATTLEEIADVIAVARFLDR